MRHRPTVKSCHRLARGMIIASVAALSACAGHPPVIQAAIIPPPPLPAPAPAPVPQLVSAGPAMVGTASWYKPGPGLHRTCTGETFSRTGMTAASHSIPVGTNVRVALLDNSQSIIVRVNDCMPRGHRILDLSEAAAEQLGLLGLGTARVSVTPVELADRR